jgi:hypothetical protein
VFVTRQVPCDGGLAPTSHARRGGAFVNCISTLLVSRGTSGVLIPTVVAGLHQHAVAAMASRRAVRRTTARLASCSIPARPGLDHWHRTATAARAAATADRHFTRARVRQGDFVLMLCAAATGSILAHSFGAVVESACADSKESPAYRCSRKRGKKSKQRVLQQQNSTAVENGICTHDRAKHAVFAASSSRHHRVAPHPKTIAAEHQQGRR